MKKFLLSLALMLLSGAAMAQSTIDLTFNRNNSAAAGTDATVTVGKTGNINIEGITSTVSCNLNWKSFSANSETFPNSSMLCPDKNTKDMTPGNEGVITFTLTNVPSEYDFKKVTFKSAALNGGGAFQGDNANAQHIDFILLDQNDNEIAKTEDIEIKVNSGGGDNVVVDLNLDINSPIKATDGTITFKLKLVNNYYTAYGCFYGLYKVSLTYATKAFAIKEQLTAEELNAKTEPTYIAIKNLSYTNNRWFVGNTGATPYSKEEFTNDAVFVWEPVEVEGNTRFHLRKLNGDYMQTASPKDFGTVENAATFEAKAAGTDGTFNGDGDSNLYLTDSNDVNIVRFVKGDNWINVQNGASGTPLYNTGTGGWTIHYVYELERTEAYEANITDAGYSTFYAPANVQIPEGVKAYYITQEGIKSGSATLTEIENVIPANTAVILEGNEGEYTFVIEENEATAIDGNLLKSTFTTTNVIGEAYVLSKQNEETGLYKTQMTAVQLSSASGSVNVFRNNANKAYLPANALPAVAQTSYSLLFNFGGNATAIESVKSELDLNAPIYNLSGRRVKAATKGIYIQNGKKFIVK